MAKGGPKPGFFSRNRGVAELTKRFAAHGLAAQLETLAAAGPAAILEIGCGEGQALLDLWSRWRHLRLHGLNKAPWEAMQGGASLRARAIAEHVFDAAEAATLCAPDVRFADASALPWPDASMDLVFSQVCIHYVARKDKVLEETWRVLKPGGRALLHVDTWKPDAPDFLRHATPRFVVHADDDDATVPLRKVLKRTAKRGFDVSTDTDAKKKKIETFVCMTKNRTEPLELGLTFDAMSSFDLHRLHTDEFKYEAYWGHRSVFRV